MKNIKLHFMALILVIIAELIGVKSFKLGGRIHSLYPHALCHGPGSSHNP